MDLNQLNWNGFPDGKLPKGFVAYELEGILKSDDGVVVVDMNYAVEYGLYGRGRDGLAVSLHDTECLDEAQARLMLLTSTLDTPSSAWDLNGDEDPHGTRFNCKRKELTLGQMTDDELANAVFLHNHRELDLAAIMAGEPSSIALLTAAKERIRWLSRRQFSARDLFWNGTDHGSLPEGSVTAVSVEDNHPVTAFRVNAQINGIEYTLHECSKSSEAYQRKALLEDLMDV